MSKILGSDEAVAKRLYPPMCSTILKQLRPFSYLCFFTFKNYGFASYALFVLSPSYSDYNVIF